MPELHFETEIAAAPDDVFATIADLRAYDRWLPRLGDYQGTIDISEGDVGLGTTYVEHSPTGTRHGEITEFERPTRITFHQPMTLKPRVAGVIDITLVYTLTPRGDGTHVDRDLTLTFPVSMKLVQPLVLPRFRKENERTLAALKDFCESGGGGSRVGDPG